MRGRRDQSKLSGEQCYMQHEKQSTFIRMLDCKTFNRKGNIKDDVCGDLSCSLILFLVLQELDFII